MIHDAGPARIAETKENGRQQAGDSAGRRCRQRMSTNDSEPEERVADQPPRTMGSAVRSAALTSGTPHVTRLINAAST